MRSLAQPQVLLLMPAVTLQAATPREPPSLAPQAGLLRLAATRRAVTPVVHTKMRPLKHPDSAVPEGFAARAAKRAGTWAQNLTVLWVTNGQLQIHLHHSAEARRPHGEPTETAGQPLLPAAPYSAVAMMMLLANHVVANPLAVMAELRAKPVVAMPKLASPLATKAFQLLAVLATLPWQC